MTAEKLADGRAVPTAAGDLAGALDRALAASAQPEPILSGAGRWWVTGGRGGIEVHAASGSHLPAAARRLARVASGPALLAVRLAVAVTGHHPFTALFPEPRRPGVLALVRCGSPAPPTQAERALFSALVRPGPAAETAGAGGSAYAALPLLRRAAEVERAWTHRVPLRDRPRLARSLDLDPLDPHGLLLVLGSHHLRAAGDVEVGQAMARLRLTGRLLGLRTTVLAGPAQLAGLRPGAVPGADRGLAPLLVLDVRTAAADPGR
ncbi:hypothetical protein BJF78_02325 [Pseudonocardia sp. CNS-139]|nr:hypothetical protein BJF78_02325 [Pseudonocardia sp. CNS-139]